MNQLGAIQHYNLLVLDERVVLYLRLAVDSCQDWPERERCQTHRQHSAMEETHHLGAAKTTL